MPSATNYLIVHGAYGSPEENWFPWLKHELEKGWGRVFVPQLPTPEGQLLSNWLKIVETELNGCLPTDTVLIGHSTGAVFVLRMAERTSQPYKAIFSVCPFARDLGLAKFDPLNASFVHPAFDWARVKQGSQKTTCFAGDNDPYVPLACTRDVADKSGAELVVIEKAGHLNAEFGYREFPLLLEKILKD